MQTMLKPIESLDLPSSVEIVAVPANQIEDIWRYVRPFIQKGLDYGPDKWGIEHVKQTLLNEQMQLIIVMQDRILAALVTEVTQFPLEKTLSVMCLGGENVHLWIDKLLKTLEKWADEMGATFEVIGRPGWERILGYKRMAVILRKPT